jgi:hypothetical protein
MSFTELEKVIKEHMVIWPESFESQLWNERVEGLLNTLKQLEIKDENH